MADADALKGRKFALDLVPKDAYWRPITELEAKCDFATLEEQEGRAVQGASLRIGMILAAQMEAYILWLENRPFTPRTWEVVPPLQKFRDEIGKELARFCTRAYYDGAEAYRSWKGRYQHQTGKIVDLPGLVGLNTAGTNKVIRDAELLGEEFCENIRKDLRKVLRSAWTAAGEQVRPLESVIAEIRGYYTKNLIRESTLNAESILDLWGAPGEVLEFAGRRMKVRDRAQHAKWQQERLPYTKFIKQTAEQIRRSGGKARELTTKQASALLQSERNRYYNQAVADSSRLDGDVWGYVFSAIRDGRTCSDCLDRDGVTLPKAHRFWNENFAPMHPGCRCQIIPVFKDETFKRTPPAEWRAISSDNVPVGYGMYNPAMVKSARALGIKTKKRA